MANSSKLLQVVINQIYPLMLLSQPLNLILERNPSTLPFIIYCTFLAPPPLFPLSFPSLTSFSFQLMSSSVIFLGPCRVRPISLPVDISWLKTTSACQYRLLVFACVPPASNTADYWRPLIVVLSCCPHSCYLADSSIVYMQMEVGYWITKTLAPNGKQTITVVCWEKVRSTELINTRKGAHYGHCDLYFLLVTSSEIKPCERWMKCWI